MSAPPPRPARPGASKRPLKLPPQRPIDRRADFHGHVLDWIGGEDRKWFERHPGETERVRLAEAHEWCDARVEGRCVALLPPTPTGHLLVVVVTYLAPGVRAKRPVYWEVDR